MFILDHKPGWLVLVLFVRHFHKIGLGEAVLHKTIKIAARDSPGKLSRFFVVLAAACDHHEPATLGYKCRDRIDHSSSDLNRQRLDGIDLEHEFKFPEPAAKWLKKVGNLKPDICIAVKPLCPRDRRRRNVKTGDVKAKIMQVPRVVA